MCVRGGWREGRAGKGQRSDVVVSASVDATDVAKGSDLDPAPQKLLCVAADEGV